MRVGVLTTSYPRDPGDAAGRFVADAVERVRARGIGVDTERSADEARKQCGDEQREPGSPPQVPDHAVAVRDPVVAVLLGPDNLDLDATRTNVVDRVGNEPTRSVAHRARIRRRQHGDAHQFSTRKTA